MKLLVCLMCSDVRKLQRTQTKCQCGQSAGMYHANGHTAEYSGPARILGVGSNELMRALCSEGAEKGDSDVCCWVKPRECARLTYIDETPTDGAAPES